MATRQNGTVKAVSTTAGGVHGAIVHYPEPPPDGETVTYPDTGDDLHDEFKSALISDDLLVDVSEDESGAPLVVVLHK